MNSDWFIVLFTSAVIGQSKQYFGACCTILRHSIKNRSIMFWQMFLVHVGGCDLAFMVDTSTSIGGEANFKLVIEFVKTIFHSFTMSASLRFGFVIFGSSVKVRKSLAFGNVAVIV